MNCKTVFIKNVDQMTVELLRDIRLDERRQLAAILEDAIQEYYDARYETDCEIQLAA